MVRLKRYALVYREHGLLQLGSEIEAENMDQAVLVARKWCQMQPGRRFIAVKNAVVAGPDILDEKVKAEVAGVKNFEELSVRAAQSAVQRGDLPIEEALEREKAGQNRKSLIEWLESKMENPETQGVPF